MADRTPLPAFLWFRSPARIRLHVFSALLLCVVSIAAASATTRTATLGVSVTVVNTCRVAVPAQIDAQALAALNAVPAVQCSGNRDASTRMVLESAEAESVSAKLRRVQFMHAANADPGELPGPAAWIRYDVHY